MSRFLHMIWALAALSVALASASADALVQREDQFKAAYVFNFVKFVAWPNEQAAQPLTICFVGAAGVYQALLTGIEQKRVGARPLAALQIADTSHLESCDVLYIEASLASMYTPVNEPALLTISDAKSFTERGGMIELFTENHRLRFQINVQSAQHAGLRISSDLLKLAAGVQREPK